MGCFPATHLLSALFLRQRQASLKCCLPHLHAMRAQHFFPPKSHRPHQICQGKATWAKCSTSAGLATPDNQTICINWNVRGTDAAPQCASLHKDECLHVCSFCSSKGHHALSWTCCTESS
ncbi:uncharacterized protein LACBIDRAFT_317149 [Laccaria bicolor S238N-H82]|uniref:Predicted protein n=1 Tax=Laccaria bicolor (strain S238N-H82 / ATCC MYA-4686) TaxID=486041 RepID=B0D4I5_LACBS|nr:uncharacterized protein LACBIDRAFT_317149 [Laccaria bicolor S238N-H82]EDR10350.1 predicted protein [Laccaria bicolor S238N-H82]|eukprot:XP_001878800.1 predicted protein [Laccaria bicolor S238N-H82]